MFVQMNQSAQEAETRKFMLLMMCTVSLDKLIELHHWVRDLGGLSL